MSEYQLRRETEAAKALLTGLRDDIGEDAELIADTVEGETGLLEAIDTALAEIDEAEILAAGIKFKVEQFTERKRAIEARRDRLRSLIEQAMAVTEQEKLKRPTATLSLRKVPPSVIVQNEADLPSEFFTAQPPPPPKLDKKALAAALAEREVPGAVLSNAGVSLTIRRS